MQTLQLLISGIAQGMIYALVAFGYNITFSTSKTLNFSLGNFLMLGGVVGFVLYMTRGYPFAAALAAVIVVGAIGGAILLKVGIEPSLRQRNAYFSSSDAAFRDRYQASEEWARVRAGELAVDGGWRIYSSGPGLYVNVLIAHAFGVRREFGARILRPCLPRSLPDLRLEWEGRPGSGSPLQ